MKSQTKKNNLSKILEINLTRNLKKEVQSKGDSSFGKEQPQQADTIDGKPVVNYIKEKWIELGKGLFHILGQS